MEDGVPRGGKAARGDGVRRARGGRGRIKRPNRKTPHPARAKRESPSPSRGEGLKVRPSKHRIIQVARTGRRKLFNEERRELFLEWFAATCNVCMSAEKAGICYQTVFKHRMKDEGFAAAWDRALAQGYAYLEARVLQEGLPSFDRSDTSVEDGPSTTGSSASGPPPHPAKPGREELGQRPTKAEVEKAFDVELALKLLREHARRLPSSPDKRKRQRTTAQVASNAEVRAALVKRLAAFGRRMGAAPGEGEHGNPQDGAEPPLPARAPHESPSPAKGRGAKG